MRTYCAVGFFPFKTIGLYYVRVRYVRLALIPSGFVLSRSLPFDIEFGKPLLFFSVPFSSKGYITYVIVALN